MAAQVVVAADADAVDEGLGGVSTPCKALKASVSARVFK
jgi:hypothetical protein